MPCGARGLSVSSNGDNVSPRHSDRCVLQVHAFPASVLAAVYINRRAYICWVTRVPGHRTDKLEQNMDAGEDKAQLYLFAQ